MISRRRTIRSKLFAYYFTLFAVFTISILIFQEHREKQYNISRLETRLNEYAVITGRMIDQCNLSGQQGYQCLDTLKTVIPPEEVRITVISRQGDVLYDNSVAGYSDMENHLERPEVQKALESTHGYHIRKSATTGIDYFYYARKYNELVIRSAVVYNVEIREFLNSGHVFIGYLIALFLVFGLILWAFASTLGDSVTKLKEFVMKVSSGDQPDPDIRFPNDELGSISREITRLYERLSTTGKELNLEKEKLISHLFVLKEGVAFFSKEKREILSNNHFITYSNVISEDFCVSAGDIFEKEAFKDISGFIDQTLRAIDSFSGAEFPRREFSLAREGRHYLIQCIFFQDMSFEILITDNTQMVKRSIMKQQLTSNIAHELKTPISSVKGYLETVLNNPELDPEKVRYFVDKAFMQTERLSLLVSDIAMLNKIEESSELYPRGIVNVVALVREVTESLRESLKLKEIQVELKIGEHVAVNANYSLLFSIFRNLMENSVNYGGEGITVTITCYHEDGGFYYFSFSDNGLGVEEEHMQRLFERFYRVDSGRSRKYGGTGLGLAIVKNAILSFRGEVSVRKRQGGGLEFLFVVA